MPWPACEHSPTRERELSSPAERKNLTLRRILTVLLTELIEKEADFDQHLEYSYNQGAKHNDVQQIIARLQKECELVNSSLWSGKA
jgi:hypothetical protein